MTKLKTSLVISAYERKPDIEYFLSSQRGDFRFRVSKKATMHADPVTLMASEPNIFIAGDLYTGRSSVIEAVAGGRRAARSIHSYLVRDDLSFPDNERRKINPRSIIKDVKVSAQIPKMVAKELPASIRKYSFVEEIQKTVFENQALMEAGRCLQCGTFCND